MNIAIDITPIQAKSQSQHKVRGAGFYIENLKNSLEKAQSSHTFIFFDRSESLSDKKIDVLHIPYFDPFFFSIPFSLPYKTIVTIHDMTPLVFPDHFPAGIKGRAIWQIQRMLLKRTSAIITDSKSSQNDISHFVSVSPSKIHTIYLAAADEFKTIHITADMRNKLSKKYNIPERFVLYVGDATWNKNLPRLVEAIKKTDLHLVMVGKALGQEVEDSHNLWNKDLVHVLNSTRNNKQFLKLGFVPTKDLVTLYNAATVFIMPSLYEGFGLPILEAMKCGCPVVSAKNSSLIEVAGDGAYFIDEESIDDIAHGILKVSSDKKLQEGLKKKGYSQVEKFSWERTALKTIETYESIS